MNYKRIHHFQEVNYSILPSNCITPVIKVLYIQLLTYIQRYVAIVYCYIKLFCSLNIYHCVYSAAVCIPLAMYMLVDKYINYVCMHCMYFVFQHLANYSCSRLTFTSISCLAMQNQSLYQRDQLVNIHTTLYIILGSNQYGQFLNPHNFFY